MIQSDHRRSEALAQPIEVIVDRLGIASLKRNGRELTGPCPQCGGRDRFSVNTLKKVFNCRQCGSNGGNIDLVMFVLSMPFPAALDWLCGPPVELTAAQQRDRDLKAQALRARNADRAERERRKARLDARAIWQEGRIAEDSPVRAYLELRGITRDRLPVLPRVIRYHPDLPYMVKAETGWTEAHRGPAMLSAIHGQDDQMIGVHRTWIDPSAPKGKARILDPVTGEALPVKKTIGSLKGGAIRLHVDQSDRAQPIMVVGEGIETTLSALIAGVPAGAAYWSGVSLGNMGGRRQTGKGQKFSGLPDMSDHDAFVPPAWVKRLIYIQDGDSEPRLTRAILEAGCRRAMIVCAGLQAQIVHAGEGVDLNDVLLGGGDA